MKAQEFKVFNYNNSSPTVSQTLSYEDMAGVSVEFQITKKDLVAYCSSWDCVRRANMKGVQSRERSYGAIKEGIGKSVDFCPDCQHALFWGIRKMYNKKRSKVC